MNSWEEKLSNARDYLRYAQCLVLEGQWMFGGLAACKAFELLLPDDNQMGNSESDHIGAADKIKFAISKIWSQVDEQEKAMAVFFQQKSYEQRPYRIRNRLIHTHFKASQEFKKDTEELIKKLSLLPRMQDESNLENYETRRNLEKKLEIREHIYRKSNIYEVRREYFENLILAKNEFIPSLLGKLKERISGEEFSMLDTNDFGVSSIDSTSAYIWVSISPKKLSEQLKRKHRKEFFHRKQIYLPSLSIVLTPLEIWTYLEFGGFTYWHRVEYYEYIFSDNFISLIEKIQIHDDKFPGKKGAILRDTHWYVFETDRVEISDLLYMEDVNEYRDKLRRKLRDKYDNFKQRVMNDKAPLTWNMGLVGWREDFSELTGKNLDIFCTETVGRFSVLLDLMQNFCKDTIPLEFDAGEQKRLELLEQYRKLIK